MTLAPALPAEARPAAAGPATGLPREVVLRDGTPAMIWPLLPEDAAALREGFRALSPQARWQRFLTGIADLDQGMLDLLVADVDGERHVALVCVVIPPDGPERPVGVGRIVQEDGDPSAADLAVTVVDDWQGRGVGAALAAALVERRAPAVRRVQTLVATGNRPSLAMLARLGRMSTGSPHAGSVDVRVELSAGR